MQGDVFVVFKLHIGKASKIKPSQAANAAIDMWLWGDKGGSGRFSIKSRTGQHQFQAGQVPISPQPFESALANCDCRRFVQVECFSTILNDVGIVDRLRFAPVGAWFENGLYIDK